MTFTCQQSAIVCVVLRMICRDQQSIPHLGCFILGGDFAITRIGMDTTPLNY